MTDAQLRDIFEDGCESVPVDERNGREMIELAGLRALAKHVWDEGEIAGTHNTAYWDGWRMTKPEMTNPYNQEETK